MHTFAWGLYVPAMKESRRSQLIILFPSLIILLYKYWTPNWEGFVSPGTVAEAVGALYQAGAISVIRSTPYSVEDSDIDTYMLNLLSRLRDLRYDVQSWDMITRFLNFQFKTYVYMKGFFKWCSLRIKIRFFVEIILALLLSCIIDFISHFITLHGQWSL